MTEYTDTAEMLQRVSTCCVGLTAELVRHLAVIKETDDAVVVTLPQEFHKLAAPRYIRAASAAISKDRGQEKTLRIMVAVDV